MFEWFFKWPFSWFITPLATLISIISKFFETSRIKEIGMRLLVDCQRANKNDGLSTYTVFGLNIELLRFIYLFEAIVSSFSTRTWGYWEGYLSIIKVMNEFDFVQWSYLMSIIDNNTLLTSIRTVTNRTLSIFTSRAYFLYDL